MVIPSRCSYYRLAPTHGEGIVYYGMMHWPSYSFWQVPDLDWDRAD